MQEIKKYLELLKQHDDPNDWEVPDGFDYTKEESDFVCAKDRIQSVLREKIKFETGIYIQDASYHSSILLEAKHTKNGEEPHPQIRFSNFGKMIAISNEENVIDSIRIDIIQHLTNLGYTYIPEDVLNEQYTGKNRGVDGIDTWWVRYFDWV